MIGRPRFTRDRRGRFRTGLGAGERELLRALPAQVRELVGSSDPSTRRLFPVAYPHDPDAQREYSEMTGSHLVEHHLRCLDTLASTVDSATLDEEEVHEWLDALEVMRLVLGTRLDVSEELLELDSSDPRAPEFALYGYLSMLQSEIIDALAQMLPDAGTEPG